MSDAEKNHLKLAVSLFLVVLWMVIQYHGWNFFVPLFFASLLQYREKTLFEPMKLSWRRDLPALMLLGAVVAVLWVWSQHITNEQGEAMIHSAAFVFGLGIPFIVLIIFNWYRSRRAGLATPR